MYKKYLTISGGIALLMMNLYSTDAFADAQCKPWNPFNDVVNISGNITLGPDTPNGTILYNIQYYAPGKAGIECSGSTSSSLSVPGKVDYSSHPLPLSSWSGSGLGGKVYESGLPGIGVIVTGLTGENNIRGNTFPRQENDFNLPRFSNVYSVGTGHGYQLWLIKTGPVTPGVINGTSMPSVKAYIDPVRQLNGLPMTIGRLSFNGVLNVISSTCNTPDVNVDLGKHDVSEFKGVGSTTKWIDSSIILNNCPAFKGYYPGSNSTLYVDGTGGATKGTPTQNVLSVSLSPQTSVVNSSAGTGIMNIESLGNGSSASGVGIQVGWGNASGSPEPFAFNTTKSISPPTDGRTSFTIPLAARYIQISQPVSAGVANGKATFLINYR
ncbi:fimbrial protein [Rosenbergiella epipactidis]|uniref:fimbrial protein n=1 Tax=Rosenbergiella epipactidis TaxID=1544694 RepID=UPI001F4E25C7|nr:fimbrial protein [Rosenbergiella epipactidis]